MDNIKLDELFHQAKNETPKVSFQETKAQFTHLVSKLSSASSANGTSSLFTIKTWTIMITTLITSIAIGSFLLMPNSVQKELNTNSKKLEIGKPNPETHVKTLVANIEEIQPKLLLQQKPPQLSTEKLEVNIKSNRENQFSFTTPILTSKSEIRKTPVKPVYIYPTLTAKEIKKNNLYKSGTIKSLVKTLKKENSVIPRGEVQIEGVVVDIDKLYMKTAEVTNIDYRVFLFDLLIQGRKQEFREAEPDQENWLKYDSSLLGLKEMYFSHSAYDYYPVNNISRKAAEMYCKWLTEETNKYLAKKGKPAINDVRIPSNAEWIYAAKGGNSQAIYPWGIQDYKNENGCYFSNFNPTECANADGGDYPVAAYSYLPNDYKLFCMSGNVAEMVYYHNNKSQPGTRGGSWSSPVEDIQINGEDKFKGVVTPNVNIGFRWVVSYAYNNKNKMGYYDSDNIFHYPIFTAKEKEHYSKVKKKMLRKSGDYFNDDYVLFQRDTVLLTQDSFHVRDVLIQSTEVTNLEYRTFLIDLIQQEKKEEYLESLPNQEVWQVDYNSFIESMGSMYLSHPIYNNYPVVGITQKGAELYCKWFTTESEKLFTPLPTEIYFTQIRIPTVGEWETAASNNEKYKMYPWVGESITDANGKYKTNCYPIEGNYTADGTYSTNSVRAYPPSPNKLYGMSGNVAELTTGKNNTIVIKGGSWESTPEEIQIYTSQDYAKTPLPNSKTGFRPVLVFEYHGSY